MPVSTSYLWHDPLVELTLSDADHLRRYRAVIEHPESITFARYDVEGLYGDIPISYSFSAGNAQWADDGHGDLGVKLPRKQAWSEDLIKWIIAHHEEADVVLAELPPRAFSVFMTRLGR